MRAIKVDLSTNFKNLIVVPLADLHLGDKNCDIAEIEKHINFIKEHENAYCILNGDIINNATKTSVSDIYNEQLTPMEQLARACNLLKPIKEKILCVTNGNHEARTWKMDGIDLMKLLCIQLGIEKKYSPESAILFLTFGSVTHSRHTKEKVCPQKYAIFCNHGSGGGKKEGAKAIRLADMAGIIDADIYIHSHTHLPMIMKEAFCRIDMRTSTFALVDKLFVNTAAMLNYGGYGEMFEFKPASKDTPYIYLNGSKREMKAHL